MEEPKNEEQNNKKLNSIENEVLPKINLNDSKPVSIIMSVDGKKVTVNAKPA
jgi:hypothetical protein